MAVNPHPCRSLAQSQLPHFRTPLLHTAPSPISLLPTNTAFLYIQTTLTCPNLLLPGTVKTVPLLSNGRNMNSYLSLVETVAFFLFFLSTIYLPFLLLS
jgi:hypothetical protein